jgi:hypothetical protein
MGARTANKHADSGGLYVSFTERDGNIEGLTESSFVSFIDINDGINFEVIDSSNDLVSELADRDNKAFGDLRVSELSILLDLNA